MSYVVIKKFLKKPAGKILRDDLIPLKGAKSRSQDPGLIRRVEMLFEVDGKKVVMAFITNNNGWAASSVGEFYQARWGIEVFFKQIKQTHQICDFLGHSKQAIRWQICSVLLPYIPMRWQDQAAGWSHSFLRLHTVVRGVVWDRIDLAAPLKLYGTADGRSGRDRAAKTHICRVIRRNLGQHAGLTHAHVNRMWALQNRKLRELP